MVKHNILGNLRCWPLWAVDDKLIYILAVVGHKEIFWTRPRDRMLSIPLGLYQTGSEYPGRSPILLVCVNPALKWTRRYFPSGASLIFERYFMLMNALHVNWLPRRHQFSLVPASDTVSRMVSPKCIIMALPFFILLLIGSVCGTSCVEVWQNTSPGDGGLNHYLVGDPTMRLHEASLKSSNAFCYPTPGGLLELEYFSCFSFLNASASSLSLV